MKEEGGERRDQQRPSRLLIDDDQSPLLSVLEHKQQSRWASHPARSPAGLSPVGDGRLRARVSASAGLATATGGPIRLSGSHSRSPESEAPSSRRSVRLLPADEWAAEHDATEVHSSVRTPPRSRHSQHGSTPHGAEEWRRPDFATFLTPGDSKTMHIQVKELEAEVASLAQELHVAQQERARANHNCEHLRKTLEEETKRNRDLARDFEKQLHDKAAELAHRTDEIIALNAQVADLNSAGVYKDLEHTRDFLKLSAAHTFAGWNAQVRRTRRHFRTIGRRMWRRKLCSMLAHWRLSTSPHLCLLRKHVGSIGLSLEHISTLERALVLAECGNQIILNQKGWMPRIRFRAFRQWRLLREEKRMHFHRLDFVRRKFIAALGSIKRTHFRAWREFKWQKFRASKLFLRLVCRNKRMCFDLWKRHRGSLQRLHTGCTRFLHSFLRSHLTRCLKGWREQVSERYHAHSVKIRLVRRLRRRLVERVLGKWLLYLSLTTDSNVVKLLQSSICPLGGRLALAKASTITWRRLARRSGRSACKAVEIARKFRKAVLAAMFSQRLLLLIRAWRLLAQLKAYGRVRGCRLALRAWQWWVGYKEHTKCVVHTGDKVARRMEQLLMYEVMAEWYALLQLRFRQVLGLAKGYFQKWMNATKAEAAVREQKGQALVWVSQRSLALRTLLLWVFRGSRARSLHLARRWVSRSFHRWVSSTFRGRYSLPDALRRADTVLEKVLFS